MQHKFRTTIWCLRIIIGCILIGVSAHATDWTGVAVSSTDQNVNILANSVVSGPVTVAAYSANINVNVVGAPRTLFGNGQLMFRAGNGFTITVNVPFNLTFQGDTSNNDLLIGFCADQNSSIIFNISDGQSVIFSGNPGTHIGGAKAFIIMRPGVNTPAVIFTRQSVATSADVSIMIGASSMLSFLAADVLGGIPAASSVGILQFNPTNSGTGNMILNIQNNGSLLVAGNYYTGDCYAEHFSRSNIDFFTPAGAQAIVQVNGSPTITSRLLVTNSNTVFSPLMIDPFDTGAFLAGDGIRRGFVVGGNGIVSALNGSYIDYVGLALNICPPPCGACAGLKARNPSALIVDGVQVFDGSGNPLATATLNFAGSSALYFRSGVDNAGNANTLSYLVNPALQTPGFGNIVLDVEGPFNVNGTSAITQALQILSIEVAPTGGSVTIDSSETTFPLRTFAKDSNGNYLQYNKGAFLINNQMNVSDVSLVHTDMLHKVYEKNDVISEATYTGGESFLIKALPYPDVSNQRPSINLINAILRLHTSAAFTGVDIGVPNVPLIGNLSQIVFYANGYCLDQGDGRNLIMGTRIGALACDNGTLINQDAHLNVMQTTAQATPTTEQLNITTAPNSSTIIQGVPAGISTQFSLHSFYLGHASNISVGTQGTSGIDSHGNSFALTTHPDLEITGNYLGFETRGGPETLPEDSGLTGRGGIFVDTNGTLGLACPIRAFFAAMVTKSSNALINLPINQILFHNRIGLQQWQLDLSDPTQQVVVPAGTTLPDYTLNWASVKKDCVNFVPFSVNGCSTCHNQQATTANITSIPVVQGTVEQFQIEHSQYGNQAHLMVDGGHIYQLIFLEGTKTGEGPVGVIAIQNEGQVGLGRGTTNLDSDSGAMKLGETGMIIIANGDGLITLNTDIEVDNTLQIVPGPDFGLYGSQALELRSEVPRQLIIKKGAILDLSGFTNPNQVLRFGGKLNVILESGTTVLLGGGALTFSGNSTLTFNPFLSINTPVGTTINSTDAIRSKLIGLGTINIQDNASVLVPSNAYASIESLADCFPTTNLTMNITGAGSFQIGNDQTLGGVFQIGDTTSVTGNSVNFNLILNGAEALFQIDSEGQFLIGAGAVNTPVGAPNNTTIAALYDLGTFSLTLSEGTFQHSQIRTGSDILASLIAIGPMAGYSFNLDYNNATVLGGGNIVNVTAPAGLVFAPVVTTTAGTINSNYAAGIASSKLLLTDASKLSLPLTNVTSAAFFDFLSVYPTTRQSTTQATITQTLVGTATVGYVFGSTILRPQNFEMYGATGRPVDLTRSLQSGSFGFATDTTGVITTIVQNNTTNGAGA